MDSYLFKAFLFKGIPILKTTAFLKGVPTFFKTFFR